MPKPYLGAIDPWCHRLARRCGTAGRAGEWLTQGLRRRKWGCARSVNGGGREFGGISAIVRCVDQIDGRKPSRAGAMLRTLTSLIAAMDHYPGSCPGLYLGL